MNVPKDLKELQYIQISLIFYLDEEIHADEKFENLIEYFKDINLYADQHKLKLVLHLIAKISDNHHRKSDFFDKIEKVLQHFKDNIKQFFTNSDIFNIFKSNKRILLFLIEESILIINENIVKKMLIDKYIFAKYHQYFAPEIRPFINYQLYLDNKKSTDQTKDWVDEIFDDLPDDFYQKRKIGENDAYICQLIRKDSVEEFIAYVNRTNCSLESIINTSIYETNLYLIRNNIEKTKNKTYEFTHSKNQKKVKINLIEYAAFFGAIQIFNYLKFNNVNLPFSLWNYAVHSDCPELIHILEENIDNIKTKVESNLFSSRFVDINSKNTGVYRITFDESIKCHHIAISNYVKNNFLSKAKKMIIKSFVKKLKNYNFTFISDDFILEKSIFYYLCKYDYYNFVENQLKNNDIHINDKMIIEKEEITPLCISIEKGSNEIAKLLLANNKIDINIQSKINIKDRNERRFINDKRLVNEYRMNLYELNSNESYIYKKVSPLQLSIEKENIELINLILSFNNLDINNYNEYSKKDDYCDFDRALVSSFYYAVLKENVEIVKLLLENKNINHNLINIYDSKFSDAFTAIERVERTALHFAAEKGNIDITNLLLKSGYYDINFPRVYFTYRDDHEGWYLDINKTERTILHIAVEKENIEMVKLLLNNEMTNVNELQKILYSEIQLNDGKLFCSTIANDTDLNSCYKWESFTNNEKYNRTQTALHIAIQNKNIEIVKLLLANEKIDVNIQYSSLSNIHEDNKINESIIKKTPLYIAIENDSVELVKLLLDHEKTDVNLSSYFYMPRCQKLYFDQTDCNDHYEDEDEVESSPLHYAVKKKNKEIIKLLLNNKKVDVNSKDNKGKKPFELAIDYSIKELFT